MKKSWILLTACAALLSGVEAIACTGLLVGKKASTDGSVMISYAADSHSLYGEMYRWPAATWPKGAMLEVKEWDTGKPLGGRALSFTGVRPSIDATLFLSEEDASKRGVGMGEEYHGEGGETACFVEAGYGRGDVLHHNRTSPGTDGGSYAERNQRSRARNGSDRPDSGICGATFTPSVGSRRKQRQWRRKQHVYAESRNINRYIR